MILDDAERIIFIFGRLEGGENLMDYSDYCQLFFGQDKCKPNSVEKNNYSNVIYYFFIYRMI